MQQQEIVYLMADVRNGQLDMLTSGQIVYIDLLTTT